MNDKKSDALANITNRCTRKQLKKGKTAGAVDKDDFNNLVDSALNVKDDGISRPDENKPLRIEKKKSKHLLDLAVSQTEGWRFSAPANQISLPDKEINVKSGLSISYCELNTDEDSWQPAKLYIGSDTGKIGINTYNPTAQLHIVQNDKKTDLLKVTLEDNPQEQPIIKVDESGATTINKPLTLNEQLVVNNGLKLSGGLVTSLSNDKLTGHHEALVTDKVVSDHIKAVDDHLNAEANRLQNLIDTKAAKEGDRAQNFNANDLVATSLNLAEGEKVTAISKAAGLGGTESSDMKIPTQKSVKDYVDDLNAAATNKIDTQAVQLSQINAELTGKIDSKANRQGDGGLDFYSNTLVANSLKLPQGDPVNAIINGSDLGGEHSSHSNLATQRAIKEYIDNAISNATRNVVYSTNSGVKILRGEKIFNRQGNRGEHAYREHHNYEEEIEMPEQFSDKFSYFLSVNVCEFNGGEPHGGQATLHTYEWFPIDNRRFKVRFRVHDYGHDIYMVIIRYVAIGH